jgi:hypothetical protein
MHKCAIKSINILRNIALYGMMTEIIRKKESNAFIQAQPKIGKGTKAASGDLHKNSAYFGGYGTG